MERTIKQPSFLTLTLCFKFTIVADDSGWILKWSVASVFVERVIKIMLKQLILFQEVNIYKGIELKRKASRKCDSFVLNFNYFGDWSVLKLLIPSPDTFEDFRLARWICVEKMLYKMTGCEASHLVQQLGCWVQVSVVHLWSVHIAKW